MDPRAIQSALPVEWSFPEIPYAAGASRARSTGSATAHPDGCSIAAGHSLQKSPASPSGTTTGLTLKPSVAWVRGRDDAATLMIGGRHLGSEGDPPATVTLTLNGQPLDQWPITAGFFFRVIPLPAGSLSGPGYQQLSVTAVSTDPARLIGVALEQFDLQPDGVPMTGVVTGWQEPEYSPLTGRAWRWMTEKATLWVRPVRRDV